MGDMNKRLTENEKNPVSLYQTQMNKTKGTEKAKEDISNIQNSCKGLQNDTKTLNQNHENNDLKLIYLEARLMRDNLMLYGIPEGGDHEDCEMLVKELCETTLKMGQAYNLKFDQVHRVGTKAAAKVRQIVRKVHYYEQWEQVRKLLFDSSEALKTENR